MRLSFYYFLLFLFSGCTLLTKTSIRREVPFGNHLAAIKLGLNDSAFVSILEHGPGQRLDSFMKNLDAVGFGINNTSYAYTYGNNAYDSPVELHNVEYKIYSNEFPSYIYYYITLYYYDGIDSMSIELDIMEATAKEIRDSIDRQKYYSYIIESVNFEDYKKTARVSRLFTAKVK